MRRASVPYSFGVRGERIVAMGGDPSGFLDGFANVLPGIRAQAGKVGRAIQSGKFMGLGLLLVDQLERGLERLSFIRVVGLCQLKQNLKLFLAGELVPPANPIGLTVDTMNCARCLSDAGQLEVVAGMSALQDGVDEDALNRWDVDGACDSESRDGQDQIGWQAAAWLRRDRIKIDAGAVGRDHPVVRQCINAQQQGRGREIGFGISHGMPFWAKG